MTSASTILIVDSHPEDLAGMAQVLGAEYRLAFAWNGRDAVAAVRKHRPALVLLEIDLPDLDGFAVCRALKADVSTAGVPVVFLAQRSRLGDEAAAFEGVEGCLFKPAQPAELLACVRRRLAQPDHGTYEAAYREALLMLGKASHFRDDKAGRHPQRMGAYAAALAEAAGWDAERSAVLELAAALHDIGELGVPDSILLKPLKLDADEWETMKTHCRLGHDMLVQHDSPVFQLAAVIALHHHEKWDGTGYPDALAGRAIPEAARIVAVADVFDALTMKRPYRQAWPVEAAIATLRGAAGTHLEPRLVDLFESILPRILDIKARSEAAARARAGS
ncbi:HD-GYP domain-containing protein [Azohydromonas aeria]|uniref:HD-GYP domain-containing protein n=1 Tax=Azohydromonas aeria TaxID=2590212 RepID=UPI0012F741D3|nr:HD domain-containing phosphohydrolase [Azohydromonas aeria]